MKNILLLNAGTRNTLVKYFKKECNNLIKVIATDNYELAPALYDADKHYVTKRWDEPNYWEEIIEICKRDNIGLIVSLIDPELELLAAHKHIFEQMGILCNVGNEEIIKKTFDKFLMLELIKKLGYPWIKTYENFETAKKAIELKDISFPLVTKPRNGSGSAGVEVVRSVERLSEICALNPDTIIQEYMQGQEIGVDVYVDLISHETISIFTKKKLKMRSGETDKSVSFKNEKLFALIDDFVQKIGLVGANDIDVFERDGEFFISEVNPRFGGGYLHAYAAGENFPRYLINNLNGTPNVRKIGDYDNDIYMMKYFDVKILKGEDIYE